MALVLVVESSLAITELCSWCLVSTQTSSLLGGFPALPVSSCRAHPTCPGPSQSPTCTELEFFSRSSWARLLTLPAPGLQAAWSGQSCRTPAVSKRDQLGFELGFGFLLHRDPSWQWPVHAVTHLSTHRVHISLWFPEEPTPVSVFTPEKGDQEGLAQLSSWDGQGTGGRRRSQPAFLQAPRCRPDDTEGAQASFLLSVCEVCKRVLNQSQLSLFL